MGKLTGVGGGCDASLTGASTGISPVSAATFCGSDPASAVGLALGPVSPPDHSEKGDSEAPGPLEGSGRGPAGVGEEGAPGGRPSRTDVNSASSGEVGGSLGIGSGREGSHRSKAGSVLGVVSLGTGAGSKNWGVQATKNVP